VEENKLLRRPSRQRFEDWLGKDLKRDHVEIGFPGRPKKYFHRGSASAFATWSDESPGDASEYDRLSGLNLCPGEKEFGLEFRQHLFHQIVLPHRDSASEEEHVRFQPLPQLIRAIAVQIQSAGGRSGVVPSLRRARALRELIAEGLESDMLLLAGGVSMGSTIW